MFSFELSLLNLNLFNASQESLLPVFSVLAPRFIKKLSAPPTWTHTDLSFWMDSSNPLLPVALVKEVKFLSKDPSVALILNKKYTPYSMPPSWLALAVFYLTNKIKRRG